MGASAKIVYALLCHGACMITLVQYAAYLRLTLTVAVQPRGQARVSFDSDYSGGNGASPLSFR